jgi:hypothetical protein
MIRKSLPHQIRKQIKRELREQQNKIVVSNVPHSADRTESTQAKSVESIDKMIYPYLMATLGNRIITGYRVAKTGACTGMQVYIMAGSAFFDLVKYVESQAGSFFTVVPYVDDQWIYIYLKPDGTFVQSKYAPMIGDNEGYIPLTMIWVEAGSTEINAKYIYDLRPNKVANLSEIYGVRSQQAELYNVIPNALVGSDDIEITDASESGVVKIHIEPNISGLLYIQGHIVVVPEETLTLTLPESGVGTDYYIIAHGYIDNAELMYKIEYRQIAVTETIERYQIILCKIEGLIPDTENLTPEMIDMSFQRKTPNLKLQEIEISMFALNYDNELQPVDEFHVKGGLFDTDSNADIIPSNIENKDLFYELNSDGDITPRT